MRALFSFHFVFVAKAHLRLPVHCYVMRCADSARCEDCMQAANRVQLRSAHSAQGLSKTQPVHVHCWTSSTFARFTFVVCNVRTRQPPAAHISVPPCPSCHPRTNRAAVGPTQHRNRPHRVSHLLALRFSSDTTEPEERLRARVSVGNSHARSSTHARLHHHASLTSPRSFPPSLVAQR